MLKLSHAAYWTHKLPNEAGYSLILLSCEYSNSTLNILPLETQYRKPLSSNHLFGGSVIQKLPSETAFPTIPWVSRTHSLHLCLDHWSSLNRTCVLSCFMNIHWKDWCWHWHSSTLVTWCKEPTHWKRLWCWERWKAGEEGDDRGWDGWRASLTQWTWVWASSGRQWKMEKPGVWQSMGLQSVGHDWEVEWQQLVVPEKYCVLSGLIVSFRVWEVSYPCQAF